MTTTEALTDINNILSSGKVTKAKLKQVNEIIAGIAGVPGTGIQSATVTADKKMKIVLTDDSEQVIDLGLSEILETGAEIMNNIFVAQDAVTQTNSNRILAENAAKNAEKASVRGENIFPAGTPTPGVDTGHVTTAGTYTNFGGVVVSAADLLSGWVQLRKVNGTWVKHIVQFDLNGVVRNNSAGAVLGSYAPSLRLDNIRANEIQGNHTYTGAKGVSLFETIDSFTAFNCVEVPFFVSSLTGNVEVRIFKGIATRNDPTTLTLLKTIIVAASDFNADSSKTMSIQLDEVLKVEAGQSVCIFAHAGSNNLHFRFWNTQSANPIRNFFVYSNLTSNPWGSAWTISQNGYFSTGFKLLYVDPVINSKLKSVEENSVSKNDLLGVTWEHPRGTEEYLGNTTYPSANGVSHFELISSKTVFNCVEVPFFVSGNEGNVDVRVYKGSATRNNPTTLTLLSSLIIPFTAFNKNANAMFSIILPEKVTIEAGQSICVFAHAGDKTISLRFWNVQAGSPARNLFVHTSNKTNPYATAWSQANDGYYSASLRLSIVDSKTAYALQALAQQVSTIPIVPVVTDTRRLIFPSNIYAAVGVELSIYLDALVLAKENGLNGHTDCTVSIECTAGVCRERYWRITPITSQIGTRTIKARVFNTKGELIEEKTATLHIIANTAPATVKNIVLVGDSTTDSTTEGVNGRLPLALAERFTDNTGATKPKLYGMRGTEPGKHEGHSAWEWAHFIGAGLGNPAPAGNPFWNTTTGMLDIPDYKAKIGLSGTLDLVSFQIGINNAWGGGNLVPDSNIQSVVINHAKTLINIFVAHNPSIKIIIQLPLTDKSVNWTIQPVKKTVYQRSIWRIREMLIENFDNAAFLPNVHIGQAGITMDRYFGYPQSQVSVGSRYSETFTEVTDNVHPRLQGYQQEADGMYPQILALLQ